MAEADRALRGRGTGVACPKCKREQTNVELTPYVSSYYDPKFKCRFKGCGFEGVVEWIRPKAKGRKMRSLQATHVPNRPGT